MSKKKIELPKTQISPILMDMKPQLDIAEQIAFFNGKTYRTTFGAINHQEIIQKLKDGDINDFIELVAFISKLGEVEHSNDWDPYFEIVMANGETLETGSGYWDIAVKGNNFEIEAAKLNDDGEDEGNTQTLIIPILDVATITLTR